MIPAPLQDSVWPNVARHAEVLVDMRRSRRKRFFLYLALFVGLPTLATFIYMFLLATPRYQSEFQATYQTYRAPESIANGIAQSFAGTSENNSVDLGSILFQYIRSPALLSQLDKELALKSYFSSPKIDYLSRLSKNASNESFLSYYRNHVTVAEGLGGYVTVDVQAFDPQFALVLTRKIAAAADAMIDQITVRARSDEIKVAEDEVTREEDRVRRSRLALEQFQNAYGDQDPEKAAAQVGDIVGKLDSDLAAAKAQLAQAQHDLSPSSPMVVQLKGQVSAIEAQIQQQRDRLANNGGATPYSKILEEYSALQLEQEFAKSAYLSAQQGLAVARAAVARKEAYLVDFAPPRAPDRPSIFYPLIVTSSVFFGALIIFAFTNLVVGAFRDQAGL